MPALCIAAATRKSQILLEDSAAQPVASDDIEELLEGDSCVVPDLDQIYERVPEDPAEQLRDLLKGTAVFILPVAGPSVAFSLWQGILQVVHGLLGEEKSLLELTQMTLNPTTNGIVVASLATALGTLTSITVWTLRSRQLDVRSCLNREACDLALLHACLSGSCTAAAAPPALRAQCLALLRQYAARVAAETSKRADLQALERQSVGENELTGIARALHAGSGSCQLGGLKEAALGYVARLNDARSQRLATLSTAFPLIHWVILTLLASSIAMCFLIEVDQSEGRFLSERPEDSLRLRLIFTMLVGTFSGLSALCADLNDPFRGSFNIVGSTKQFFSILAGIDKELENVLVMLNPSLTRGDVERAMKAAADRNGSVDYEEFAQWLQERCSSSALK